MAFNDDLYRDSINVQNIERDISSLNKEISNKSCPLTIDFGYLDLTILYNPSDDLKSGMPALHEIPAPVNTVIFLLLEMNLITSFSLIEVSERISFGESNKSIGIMIVCFVCVCVYVIASKCPF